MDSKPSYGSPEENLSSRTQLEHQHADPPCTLQKPWDLDYGILKLVFQFLKIRDLLNSARVCKQWLKVTKIVRKQRINRPHLLLYHVYPLERTREVIELSNDFRVSPSTVSWAEDPSTANRHSRLTKEVRTKILEDELEQALWSGINNQFSEPAQIICIGTDSLAPYLRLRSDSLSTKINLFRRVGKIVPCVGLLGYGLVLTLPDNSLCLENECRSRSKFLPMLTGMVIPKLSNLKIKMFSLGTDAVKYPKGQVTKENCEQLLNINPEDNVKGIILFQTHQTRASEENFLLSAIYEYLKKHPNVAFGGGIFKEALTHEDSGRLIGCGWIITGDENVRVGSTAFLDEGITDGNLKNLRKFKEAALPGTNDFAFMFCCNGRGLLMHDAEHVESTLFRSEFPSVPLIGAFTGGEYFHPYITGQASTPVNTISALKFGYTTVFVYISCSR